MRRHSVCVHNPPCCYISDPGTDSSLTECCFPQCKNHPKKKKPHHSASTLRHNKRRDSIQLLPKHCYGPHFSNLKCNKTKTQVLNYENKVLRHDLKKTKYKTLRKHDEASSYDVGSVSSQCTSLSVDVTYEMDAVNKDIETILARYEKTFDEKAIDDIGPRFRTTDRARHYKAKKETLTPEQLKLLSMEKPPLDKLKELPIEYVEHLKPRPPPSHFHREKVLTGHKGVKKDLKQSFEAYIQKEQRTGENQKSEMLESMWKNVVERGLAKEDLAKNIKPIYTSMTLDENASININFGKPNPNQEPQQKKGTSVGTVISPRMKTNPSVSTQTVTDFDTVLNRIKVTSPTNSGSNKKIEDNQKKSYRDCSPDLKNWKEIPEDQDIGDSEKKNIKKSMSPPPHHPKSSGDGLSTNDPKLMLNQLLSNKVESKPKPKSSATVFTQSQPKELNVFNVHTSDGINIFKQADWFKSNADHLLSSNGLHPKKSPDISNSEKLIAAINNRMYTDTSNKGKENSPPTIEDSLIEDLNKNSPRLDNKLDKNLIPDDKLRDISENINASTKFFENIGVQDDKIACSFFQTISPDLKYLKENYDGLDTPLCVDIIKRLTDAMMKCEPGKISDELTKRNCHLCLEEVRKIRAQHLKHIQIEVKHIEELDKFIKDVLRIIK